MSKKRYETKKMKKEKLLEALEKHLGVITTACKACNLNRQTYYNYYKDDEEFAKAADDIQNIAIDFVETKLFQNIQKGDTASTIFYLKTKAKNRGYSERFEIEGNHKIEQIIIEPYDKDKED